MDVDLAAIAGARGVILVEGTSDQAALEALAGRRGQDLAASGVAIAAMGGATSIGHYLDLLGPRGQDVRLAGLCDAAEEGYFRRALWRASLTAGPSQAGQRAGLRPGGTGDGPAEAGM